MMGRYGAKNSPSKVARHLASYRVAYVAVVTSFSIPRIAKLKKNKKKKRHLGRNRQIRRSCTVWIDYLP